MPGKNDLTLLSYALLCGLTILVPIPFLDDWLKLQVQRRMLALTLKSHGYSASAEEVDLLAPADDPGCLRGCLLGGLVYLVKKLIRQLIPFLEWSRAVDTVSQTYYHGYLVDYALRNARYRPGDLRQAARIKYAIHPARRRSNTRFISQAIRQTLERSRQTLWDTARWMGMEINRNVFRRGRAALTGLLLGIVRRLPQRWQERFNRCFKLEPLEETLEEIIENTPARQKPAFDRLLNDLQQAIASTSEQPLRLLEEHFEQALAAPPLPLAD